MNERLAVPRRNVYSIFHSEHAIFCIPHTQRATMVGERGREVELEQSRVLPVEQSVVNWSYTSSVVRCACACSEDVKSRRSSVHVLVHRTRSTTIASYQPTFRVCCFQRFQRAD